MHYYAKSCENIPYFRISHKTFAKTNCSTRSSKSTMGVIFCDGVHVCRVCSLDGVAVQTFLGCDTPAIVDAVVHY